MQCYRPSAVRKALPRLVIARAGTRARNALLIGGSYRAAPPRVLLDQPAARIPDARGIAREKCRPSPAHPQRSPPGAGPSALARRAGGSAALRDTVGTTWPRSAATHADLEPQAASQCRRGEPARPTAGGWVPRLARIETGPRLPHRGCARPGGTGPPRRPAAPRERPRGDDATMSFAEPHRGLIRPRERSAGAGSTRALPARRARELALR